MEYTKEEIANAKKLITVLYPHDNINEDWRVTTSWGTKTHTGLINTILAIVYPNKIGEIKP